MNEFEKFATKGQGIGSATLSRYASAFDAYINPTITEERKLNVAQMDVFSRLDLKECLFAAAWHDRGPHFPRRIGHQVEDAPAPRLPVPDREHRGRAE